MPGALERQLAELRHGDHLCLLYEEPAEQMAAAVPFIQDGLARGERCLYVTEERTAAEVCRALAAAQVDVRAARDRGALVLLTKRETYLRRGRFDPEEMVDYCREAVREAVDQGYSGLRITGEMSWALGGEDGCDRLIEYEALLNEFFPTSRALAICQHNRRRCPPETLEGILRTHPIAILGEQVCPNPFYEPASLVLDRGKAAERVVWKIGQLQRSRADAQRLEELNRRLAEKTCALEAELERRRQAEEALRQARAALEQRVEERTAELARANSDLLAEVNTRCQAVEALQQIREEWEQCFNALPDHICILDLSGAILRANRAMRERWEPVHGSLIGLDYRLLYCGTVAPDPPPPWAAVLSGGDSVALETTLPTMPGWFLVLSYPLCDGEEKRWGAISVIRDVSERRAAEEALKRAYDGMEARVRERTSQLEEANAVLQVEIGERQRLEKELRERARALVEADRRKDEFLAMLAHELRNPLAPIRNSVEVLRGLTSEDPRVRRAHEVVERQVAHMSRLVDDLLDVARITRGSIELRREPVDLAEAARHAVQTSRALIASRGHRLEVVLPDTPLMVDADPTRMEQVIGNLLNNAAKYTEPGGRIELGVDREAGKATIRVRDTGAGISPDLLPHVFDLFVQADQSLDRAQGGLGIGLTMVRKLVQMHGGTVEALSAGPGHGSEFVVRLPERVPPEGERAAIPGPRPESRRPARVLVVDDSADAVETLCDLLRLWGHAACGVHDGPEALTAAREFRPDIILLDIGLPGMSGYEVAERLRACGGLGGARLVALTGYGQDEDRLRSQEAGFDRHLVKPFDPVDLRKIIAGLAALPGGMD